MRSIAIKKGSLDSSLAREGRDEVVQADIQGQR